jgi:hypothetical protein
MIVPQLLDEVLQQVPVHAPVGQRWKAETAVHLPDGSHQVAVAARIDHQGCRREQFWCDGVRVEKAVLLRLTCPERECPHVQQVQAQWLAFRGRGKVTRRTHAPQPHPLMTEVKLRVGPQRASARPARFPCFTPCPHQAHPPLTFDKQGFDLFDNGVCMGGGVTEGPPARRPDFPRCVPPRPMCWPVSWKRRWRSMRHGVHWAGGPTPRTAPTDADGRPARASVSGLRARASVDRR